MKLSLENYGGGYDVELLRWYFAKLGAPKYVLSTETFTVYGIIITWEKRDFN